MPITRRQGDTEDSFIKRCIPVEIEHGKPQDQAVAICYGMWREGKKEASIGNREKAANIADYLESEIHRFFTNWADGAFGEGRLTREERIGLSSLIGDALDAFHRGLQRPEFADLRTRRPYVELEQVPGTAQVEYGEKEAEPASPDDFEAKATWEASRVNDLPDSSFLHVEDGDKDETGKTVPRASRHLPYRDADGKIDLPHLRNAISRLSQSDTGTGDDKWLTGDLRTKLLVHARKLLGSEQKDAFVVWKDTKTGRWVWAGVWSNKFRDRDNPPEILSDASHKDFVRAVDSGEWAAPELQVWHVPATTIGKALFVGYDDRGFQIAAGTIENETAARALAVREDLGMSHGMPVGEIQRDPTDPTVITRYRSKEISVLPIGAAANPLTDFTTEATMLPDEKKEFLASILGEDAVKALDDKVETLAEKAEGMEYKADAESPAPDAAPPGPAPLTREEVAEAVGQVVNKLSEQMQAMGEVIGALATSVKEMRETVDALQQEDETKIAKAAELTPAA